MLWHGSVLAAVPAHSSATPLPGRNEGVRAAHGACLPSVPRPPLPVVPSFLMYELLFYVTWLASFITFTFLFEGLDPELSLLELLQTTQGAVTLGANMLSLTAMVPFVYMEVRGQGACCSYLSRLCGKQEGDQ